MLGLAMELSITIRFTSQQREIFLGLLRVIWPRRSHVEEALRLRRLLENLRRRKAWVPQSFLDFMEKGFDGEIDTENLPRRFQGKFTSFLVDLLLKTWD